MIGWLHFSMVGCAALAVQGSSGDLGSATPSCPDTKASQVDARVETAGDIDTCGLGLVIFGVGGAIVGDDCPEVRLFYPSHQECLGEKGVGKRCVSGGDLTVRKEDCECGGMILPLIEIGIPTECECKIDPAGGGTIEDSGTENCWIGI
ncbi:MAG: hypothetical protein IT454_07655 [Planctomycetes bacterium]|nr:hypothetical protein [Planctomycetota bacterium]